MLVDHGFDLGRVDVDAARDDHVLLAVADEEVALVVEVRDVTHRLPVRAVLGEAFVGVVVAVHLERGPDEQLTRFAERRFRTVVEDDAHLDRPVGLAARTGFSQLVLRRQDRHHPELGGAVHLVEESVAELGDQLLLQRVRDRRGVGDERAHRRKVGARELTRWERDDALELRGCAERVGDAVFLDQPEPRGGIELPQDDDRPADRVRERREGERAGVVERPGGDVHRVGHEQVQPLEHGAHRTRVGARAQRALRSAGRARRVDHGCAGRPDSDGHIGVDGRVGLRREQIVPPGAARGNVAPEHEDAADLGQLVEHRRDRGCLFGVDHDHRCVGVVDDELHLAGVEAVRDGDRRERGLPARVDRGDDLERVRSAPRDAIAGDGAERGERVSQPVGRRLEFRVVGR